MTPHLRSLTLASILLATAAAGAAHAAESAATTIAPPNAPVAPAPPPKLTPQAEAEFERMMKAIGKLKEDYAVKAIAELEKGRQALVKAQAAAAKAGDTEGEKAIQAKLADLEGTTLLRIGLDVDDGLAPIVPQSPVLGEWRSGPYLYQFKGNGEMRLFGHAATTEKGDWKEVAPSTYQVIWPWGTDRLILDSGREGRLFWPDGTVHGFTRVR